MGVSTQQLSSLIDLYLDGDPNWETTAAWHGAKIEYPLSEGARTSEADNMKYALRDMRNTVIRYDKPGEELATRRNESASWRHIEDLNADDFTPADLRAVQSHMINIGLCRNQVNARKNRILRFFRWANSYGFCELDTIKRLENVTAVKPHYRGVRESKPVKLVPPDIVKRTIDCARPVVARAIKVQMLTGMRPKELVMMKLSEVRLSHSREVWEYRPEHHKTAHKRIKRIIKIGPQAQMMLREVVSWCVNQGELADGEIKAPKLGGDDPRRIWPWKTVNGYYQAVRSAAKRAGENWAPNQLRHYTLTRAYEVLGIDAAAQVGGHTDKKTTYQNYIEPELAHAERYANDHG